MIEPKLKIETAQTNPMSIEKNIPDLILHDGHSIPALGFGTYTLKGQQGVDTMLRALGHGIACWILRLIMKMKVL